MMTFAEIFPVLVTGVVGLFMFFKWRDKRHFADIDMSIEFVKHELTECKTERVNLQIQVSELQDQLRKYIEGDLERLRAEPAFKPGLTTTSQS